MHHRNLLPFLALATAWATASSAHAAASHYNDAEIKLHVIAAAPNGRPIMPGIREKANDEFESVLHESETLNNDDYDKYLNAMVAAIRKSGRKEILIFIHGGLNFPGKGLKRSANLGQKIAESGYYPIFINWNSGPLSTYGEHLFLVRQGQRNAFLGVVTSPFILLSDLSRAAARAPSVWLTLTGNHLNIGGSKRTNFAHESYRYLRENDPQSVPDVTTSSLRELDQRDGVQLASNSVHDALFVAKAPAAYILDAIGTGAWDMMVRRSHLLFDSPVRFQYEKAGDRKHIDEIVRVAKAEPRGVPRSAGDKARIDRELAQLLNNQAPGPQITSDRARVNYHTRSQPGAAEQFLDKLDQSLGEGYHITLIGHSMGAIVSNEILIRHPKLPFQNIVYMAAACSIKECEDAVIPYLRGNPKANFYNLALHPAAEVTESFLAPESEKPDFSEYAQSSLGLIVPRGSLLQWLDAFFTHPVHYEDRRYGKWSATIGSAGIFRNLGGVADRVHLTMFRVGKFGVPQKHGQFGSPEFTTPFWKKDFWQPNRVVQETPQQAPMTVAPGMR